MSVDVIGALYSSANGVRGGAVQISGFHVNVTPDVLEARPGLEPFVVNPAALSRVWAGDNPASPVLTVALRFADDTEALSFFPAV